MEHDVLHVDREVQQDDREEHRGPVGRRDVLKQTPPARFGKQGDPYHAQGSHETQQKAVDHNEPQVAGPPQGPARRQCPPRN